MSWIVSVTVMMALETSSSSDPVSVESDVDGQANPAPLINNIF